MSITHHCLCFAKVHAHIHMQTLPWLTFSSQQWEHALQRLNSPGSNCMMHLPPTALRNLTSLTSFVAFRQWDTQLNPLICLLLHGECCLRKWFTCTHRHRCLICIQIIYKHRVETSIKSINAKVFALHSLGVCLNFHNGEITKSHSQMQMVFWKRGGTWTWTLSFSWVKKTLRWKTSEAAK